MSYKDSTLRKLFIVACLVLLCLPVSAQFTYGTTGLLHMPTADMQKDKTFMAGGGYLNKHATPDRWSYDTWNYYINITFFPWMEVAYTCTIFDEMKGNVHMMNQDRNFSGRLRLWKEGWWKEWTPQIVAGVNYRFLCKARRVDEGGKRGKRYYATIVVHKPLAGRGDLQILSIEKQSR